MKTYFWDFMALAKVVDFKPQNRNVQRHQENKIISGKIKQQNHSRSLGQHNFVYLSHRSR